MAKSRKSDTATGTAKDGVEKQNEVEDTSTVVAETDIPDGPGTGTELGDASVKKDASIDDVADEVAKAEDTSVLEPALDVIEEATDTPSDAALDAAEIVNAGDADDSLYDQQDNVEGETPSETTDADAPEKETNADGENTQQSDSPWDKNTEAEVSDKETPDAEPERAETPVAQPQPEVVRGSIWPAIFGGVIAAMIGFIAGRGDTLDTFLPASMQRTVVDTTALEAATAEVAAVADGQASLLEAQGVRLDALETVDMAAVLAMVAQLEADIAALTNTVSGVTGNLAALEEQEPVVIEADNTEANEAIASLQAALDEQNAEIAALAERAAAAESGAASEAAQILARAALTQVVTAVDSGQPFGAALADLEEVTPVEVPAPLKEAAENGVPTMAALREGFADVARVALTAARAETPESEVVSITGFFQRQLNMRSVTPREGSDPDAILSRAQAAVENGDLTTAIAETDGLPEVARVAMADWLAAAKSRKAAQDAANELADSLNSN